MGLRSMPLPQGQGQPQPGVGGAKSMQPPQAQPGMSMGGGIPWNYAAQAARMIQPPMPTRNIQPIPRQPVYGQPTSGAQYGRALIGNVGTN